MTDTRSMKLKGVLFSVLSAMIFGTSPIFFKTIAATGINTTTQVVLRSIVTMALAAVLAGVKKQPILLKGRLLFDAMMAFVLGQGLTAILLNSSYAYLPAGMSTSLHFVYPSVVMDEFAPGMTDNKDETFEPNMSKSYNDALLVCDDFVKGNEQEMSIYVSPEDDHFFAVTFNRKTDEKTTLSVRFHLWNR